MKKFRDIPGFEGLYKMSPDSEVYSIKRGKVLKRTKNVRYFYNLSKGGNHYYFDEETLFNTVYPEIDIIYKEKPLGVKSKLTQDFHLNDITILENYKLNLIKILENSKTLKKDKDKILNEITSVDRHLRDVNKEM